MLVGARRQHSDRRPFDERRRALERFIRAAAKPGKLRAFAADTPIAQQAQRWLDEAGAGATDGVVAKRLDDPYQPGERAMIKVKRLRTADCVVGGFRYESDSREVGSLLLGLYDDDGQARPCRLHLDHHR